MDSYDVFKQKDETYLRETILRAARLFSGGKKYTTVCERYDL
jgi:hypothetical protein